MLQQNRLKWELFFSWKFFWLAYAQYFVDNVKLFVLIKWYGDSNGLVRNDGSHREWKWQQYSMYLYVCRNRRNPNEKRNRFRMEKPVDYSCCTNNVSRKHNFKPNGTNTTNMNLCTFYTNIALVFILFFFIFLSFRPKRPTALSLLWI